MLEITSSSNTRVKYIKSLERKKERMKNRQYTVEGKKSVHDALLSDKSIALIAVSDTFFETEKFTFPENIELLKLSDSIFHKLSDTAAPQGIMAVLDMEEEGGEDLDTDKAYIYCDSVNDPGNLGTIIRTADAAGMGGVILSKNCADLYGPKTVRASMGSFFNTKIFTDKDTDDLLKYKDMGFSLIGGALGEDSENYLKKDFTKPVIIIVGNEANGISDEVLSLCEKVKIPIIGKAESLNVSVAAAVLMYEIVRQRS